MTRVQKCINEIAKIFTFNPKTRNILLYAFIFVGYYIKHDLLQTQVNVLLLNFIVVVSICLVCDSSIVATCPSIPAARFAFCFVCILFVLFLMLVVVFFW